MKLIDLKGITLPHKKNETFKKIELEPLYTYDFKTHQRIRLNNHVVALTKDTSVYESMLFNLSFTLDAHQEVLTLTQTLNEPLILVHETTSDETLFSHSLKIELLQGVQANIIEVFNSNHLNSALIINRELQLHENASLLYTKIQNVSHSNHMLYNLKFHQTHNTNCELFCFEYGDGFVVNTYENILNEKNSTYALHGLVKLTHQAYVANIVQTTHNNESSISNIDFKHTLKESSTAVFKAKSKVNETALFSKAFQNSNTLLLSNNATIIAQPHLEIFTDELEASHGATTGTLDKEQVLYLQTRGIGESLAHDMLLEAFEAQVYHAIPNDDIKKYVLQYKGVHHV